MLSPELAKLNPSVAATGHGKPMYGEELKKALNKLKNNFYETAIPPHGRYVPYPAITNNNGVMYVPPKKPNLNEKALTAFGISAIIALALFYTGCKTKKEK